MNSTKIKEMLSFIHGGNPVEIRILNVPKAGVISGYYDDYEKLEKDIEDYNGTANIYMTLNRINPNIILECQNKLEKFAKTTTKDKDISRRQWMMIDFDPKRETNTPSTKEELKSAEILMREVLDFLSEYGFSRPVKAMSGNGYHLLYSIDLENNPENDSLIRNFLKVLSDKFTTENVEIDKTTHNASRITKLYGTISCKGKHSDERPYRFSYICSKPKKLETTKVNVIQKVINLLSGNKEQNKQYKPCNSKFIDVERWLKEHNIAIDRIKKEDDRTIYVLKECPWNSEHKDKAAYVIQYKNGGISAGCHHDSCNEQNWNTLQKLYSLESGEHNKDDRRSITDILMDELEALGHTYFHDDENIGYVEIPGDSHRFMLLQSIEFEQYIRHYYRNKYRKSLKKDAIKQLIDTLDAEAEYGELRKIYFRCAYVNDCVYYYIADADENVIIIDKQGYRVEKNTSIPFIKNNKMKEQVLPLESPYSLREITEKYWCFKDEKYKILHDVLLVSRFLPHIVPVIAVYLGTMGSAKTTSMKQDKMVVDPNVIDVRVQPKNIGDLVLICKSQYMVCLDNLGKIKPEVSDLFCVSSTGGYYSVRLLYANRELNDVKVDTRINLTGINMPTDHPDFFDRTCTLELDALSEDDRKPVEEVMENFKAELPYLLDVIFKTLSEAMKIKDQVKLKRLPRMADWSIWGYAIAEALGYSGEKFLKIYNNNRAEVETNIIGEDIFATLILHLCRDKGYIFEGSATEILQDIKYVAKKENIDIRYDFPRSPSTFSGRIMELKPLLKKEGIIYIKLRSNGKRSSYLGLEEGLED